MLINYLVVSMRIKKIGVLSLGKILGLLYAMMGLIVGALYSLFTLIGLSMSQAFSPSSGPALVFGLIFGIGAIIFLPVFYGVMGFIVGIVTAVLYNFIASKLGGLEFEVEK